jgi:hypothetical protein
MNNLRYQTMKRQPQAFHTLLSDNNALAKLQRHSRQLQQLTETVRSCLPDSTANHLHACSFDGSQLTLFACTAAEATSLRLASSNLLQTLRMNHLPQLSNIRIRIIVDPIQPSTHQSRTNPPSDNTAQLLSELAETAIDPAIKSILQRLSQRFKPQKTKLFQ